MFYPIFIQEMGQRLVGVDMVIDGVAAWPVHLECPELFHLFHMLRDKLSDEKARTQQPHTVCIDRKMTRCFLHRQIHIERRLLCIWQKGLKHGEKERREARILHL